MENTPPPKKKFLKNLSKYVFGINNEGDLWAMCDCNVWPNYDTQMLMAHKCSRFIIKIFFNIKSSDS